MSEFSYSPEHAAQAALHEYLNSGASAPLGLLPIEKLEQWQAALEGQRLKPEQQLDAAWVTIEHAFSYTVGQNDTAENRPTAKADLIHAEKLLGPLVGKAGINRVTEAQAILALNSLPIIESVVMDDPEAMIKGYEAFYDGQLAAAKLILKNYERYGNVSDVPLLHSLAVMAVVAQEVKNQLFVLPAPTRAIRSSNAKDSWSMVILNLAASSQNLLRARVAATSPMGFLSVPPTILQNDQYPSKHGHGTLQALIEDRADRQMPRYVNNPRDLDRSTQIRRYSKADRHIQRVNDDLHKHLYAFMDKKVETDIVGEEIPTDPALIYLDIDAHRHSSLIPGDSLDKLISAFEVSYCGDELSPRNSLVLGWMHIESGLKAVTDNEVSDSTGGSFERAAEIFGNSASQFFENDQTGAGYEALISLAAAEMYQAFCLAGDSEEQIEEITKAYNAQLTDIGEELLERFASLDDYSTPEAHSIHATLYTLSAILAANVGTGGGHIAVPSTPRQRGMTERNNTGWNVSILPLTATGFKPDYYGKLRVANAQEQRFIDSNIVTISTRDLNPDNSFAVLRHGMDLVDNRATNPQQQALFDKAVEKVTKAAELSEW